MFRLKTHATQSIQAAGKVITFEQPLIMGILNVTPNSFFDGGKHEGTKQALAHAGRLIAEGADIIDIGAYSSRPGAPLISVAEELNRALPVVQQLKQLYPEVLLSIDTFRSEVAETCVAAGVDIINDISGGTLDEDMFATVAKLGVPYVLMHMRGKPETMQNLTQYNDVVEDVGFALAEKLAVLRELGIKDIIIDPGFGFAKTVEQSHELLHRIEELHYLGLPILGGISRKSMIYKKLNITPSEALAGTIALNSILLSKGVQILRVHDVSETKQLVKLLY